VPLSDVGLLEGIEEMAKLRVRRFESLRKAELLIVHQTKRGRLSAEEGNLGREEEQEEEAGRRGRRREEAVKHTSRIKATPFS